MAGHNASVSAELKQHFPLDLRWLDRFDPTTRLITGRPYEVCKRVLDAFLIICASPALLPAFVLCAVLIKFESPGGPLFFMQERTGRHGRRFQMYKFRTMVPEAETLKDDVMRFNERRWPDFRITHDPRVTGVGAILRKTGLDELPQFFNVVRGDMSLVGPRPTSFQCETYDLWQTERLEVTPGITGLWQIVGRDASEFDERARLDIAYIERRCLSVDIQIMWRTVAATLAHLRR